MTKQTEPDHDAARAHADMLTKRAEYVGANGPLIDKWDANLARAYLGRDRQLDEVDRAWLKQRERHLTELAEARAELAKCGQCGDRIVPGMAYVTCGTCEDDCERAEAERMRGALDRVQAEAIEASAKGSSATLHGLCGRILGIVARPSS